MTSNGLNTVPITVTSADVYFVIHNGVSKINTITHEALHKLNKCENGYIKDYFNFLRTSDVCAD